jgi:hypothetical protein
MRAETQIKGSEEAAFSALSDVALEIMSERNETEREIKRLAEAGQRDAAWKLLVEHLKIVEPRRLKAVK